MPEETSDEDDKSIRAVEEYKRRLHIAFRGVKGCIPRNEIAARKEAKARELAVKRAKARELENLREEMAAMKEGRAKQLAPTQAKGQQTSDDELKRRLHTAFRGAKGCIPRNMDGDEYYGKPRTKDHTKRTGKYTVPKNLTRKQQRRRIMDIYFGR